MSKFSESERKRALEKVGEPPISWLKIVLQVMSAVVWFVVMVEVTVHILR